ncbi:acyl-CoA thioesterase [Eisenibacter elegans]|jgi:acyl-CoA thioester hydrolase|uniref:acyl-CoA thioesterase n=1 Tax=Eisenibacter elegans TaxID=997 RepID=UPI00040BC0F4|nr:thioesterase family protein [Eisenibacter elegans]
MEEFSRQAFRFVHELRVRWAEVDSQNIVFNGNYLHYFDIGITEYFRALGLPFGTGNQDLGELFVRKATLEYHAPAHFDDWLQVRVRTERIGNSSLQFALAITRQDEEGIRLLVSGALVYVHTNAQTRRPEAVPELLRQKLQTYDQLR